MRFFLSCVPPTTNHHSKRIVRVKGVGRLADSPALDGAKSTLDTLLLDHQPETAMAGAVALTLAFVFPYTSSVPKKRRGTLIPKTTKPDCDNLAKTITDRLAALRFIEGDAQVVRLVVSKDMGAVPGIHVQLHPFDLGSRDPHDSDPGDE